MLLVIACAVLVHFPARAQAPAAGCARALVVAVSPIGRSIMIAPSGEVSGVMRDFLDLVTRATGCQFDYLPVARARAFALFRTGAIDIMPSVTRTPERDGYGTFVKTHGVRPMLISLRERKLALHSVGELVDSAVSFDVVRGYEYGPSYDAVLNQPRLAGRVQRSTDPETIARKLAAGRMDAALMPPSTLVEAADKLGLSERLDFAELDGLAAVEAGIYLVRGGLRPDDADRVQHAFEALVRQGEFERLQRQYYAHPAWASKGLQFFTSHKKE